MTLLLYHWKRSRSQPVKGSHWVNLAWSMFDKTMLHFIILSQWLRKCSWFVFIWLERSNLTFAIVTFFQNFLTSKTELSLLQHFFEFSSGLSDCSQNPSREITLAVAVGFPSNGLSLYLSLYNHKAKKLSSLFPLTSFTSSVHWLSFIRFSSQEK